MAEATEDLMALHVAMQRYLKANGEIWPQAPPAAGKLAPTGSFGRLPSSLLVPQTGIGNIPGTHHFRVILLSMKRIGLTRKRELPTGKKTKKRENRICVGIPPRMEPSEDTGGLQLKSGNWDV